MIRTFSLVTLLKNSNYRKCRVNLPYCMYYAVEGCAHGQLDLIYDSIRRIESYQGIKIELLIVCGDLEASRNAEDLGCVAVPEKYRRLGDFYQYYAGTKLAPLLTIVIGGNHEASNYLKELYYGGWLADNIYYLGCTGCVQFAGLRIAGISGIYNRRDENLPTTETPPFTRGTERSIYHIRRSDAEKLSLLSPSIDIMVSHDWPLGITDFGNIERLLRQKPHFEDDISRKRLGNPHAMSLLRLLKPSYWFSAHLHTKFAAILSHDGHRKTRFLALDKPGPRRNFLQVLYAQNADSSRTLLMDREWVAILRVTEKTKLLPNPLIDTEMLISREIAELGAKCENIEIPSFQRSVPYGSWTSGGRSARYLSTNNPQTDLLIKSIGLSFTVFDHREALNKYTPDALLEKAASIAVRTEFVAKLVSPHNNSTEQLSGKDATSHIAVREPELSESDSSGKGDCMLCSCSGTCSCEHR